MCELNGEFIVFGGSDETPGTPNSQPVSKEVDAFVYHVRPRLRRTLPGLSQRGGFGGSGSGGRGGGGEGVGGSANLLAERLPSPPQPATVRHDRALFRGHERAMAEEVIAHMGAVEAAQERRAQAARGAAGGDVVSLGGVAAPRFAAEGRVASGANGAAVSSREHQQGPATYPYTSRAGAATCLECDRATAGLPRPERTTAPVRPYGVKVRPSCLFLSAARFETKCRCSSRCIFGGCVVSPGSCGCLLAWMITPIAEFGEPFLSQSAPCRPANVFGFTRNSPTTHV